MDALPASRSSPAIEAFGATMRQQKADGRTFTLAWADALRTLPNAAVADRAALEATRAAWHSAYTDQPSRLAYLAADLVDAA